MIRNSFIIFEGIGRKKETGLWKRGIREWRDLLSSGCNDALASQIMEAEIRYALHDAHYFSTALGSREKWRLLRDFIDRALFVDVEVLNQGRFVPVIIGIYSQKGFAQLTGSEISGEVLMEHLSGASIMVTFNGSAHDVPILKHLVRCKLPPHVDLRGVAMKLGYSGGLKSLELSAGIGRRRDIVLSCMGNTSRLWRMHRSGNRRALEILLEYNRQDVMNMLPLAERMGKELEERYMNA